MLKNTFIKWDIPYGRLKDSNSYEIETLKKQISILDRKLNSLRPQEPLYLSIEETMELCRISSPTTLWNWKKAGTLIPKAKAGRKPLYLRKDVVDFLNNK